MSQKQRHYRKHNNISQNTILQKIHFIKQRVSKITSFRKTHYRKHNISRNTPTFQIVERVGTMLVSTWAAKYIPASSATPWSNGGSTPMLYKTPNPDMMSGALIPGCTKYTLICAWFLCCLDAASVLK